MHDRSDAAAGEISGLLQRGSTLEAYDRIRAERTVDATSPDLIALEARVLEKLGMRPRALALLEDLQAEDDAEILGLRAAMEKRQALSQASPEDRAAGLRRALALYEHGWRRLGGSWFGINVASLAHALGEAGRAEAVAATVLAVLDAESTESDVPDEATAWALATRAEANLICGREDEALEGYRELRAYVEPRSLWEALLGARRNAALVIQSVSGASAPRGIHASMVDALTLPPVAIAVGHIVDTPGRKHPRLPEALVPAVRRAVSDTLDTRGVSVGYSSLAAGTDLIFQEELERRGASRHALLPYESKVFCDHSVLGRGRLPWGRAFQRLRRGATRTSQAARYHHGRESVSYRFANEVQLGLALLEADRLDTDVVGVAVWDERSGDGPGGTQSVVKLWRDSGELSAIHVIHPQELPGWSEIDGAPLPPQADPPYPWEDEAFSFDLDSSAIAGILFADAKGFSKLDDHQSEVFVEKILGAVAEVQRRYEESIYDRNTWGDGLFYVFRDLEAGARFALDVSEVMEGLEPRLEAWGLPRGLGFRLALHAGPVRILRDPVTGRVRASGSEISFGARIEPVAPINQVYASEAFAALARARRLRGFECRYVGIRDLAKQYGMAALYHLERSGTVPGPRP